MLSRVCAAHRAAQRPRKLLSAGYAAASAARSTCVRHLYNHVTAVQPLLAADASLSSRLLEQLVHEGAYDPEMVHAAAQTVHSREDWLRLYNRIHQERDLRPLGELNLYCLLAASARYGVLPHAAQLSVDVALDASDRAAVARSCVAPLVHMCATVRELDCVHALMTHLCADADVDPSRLHALLLQLRDDSDQPGTAPVAPYPVLATLALTHGCDRADSVARAWLDSPHAASLPAYCAHAIMKPLLTAPDAASSRKGASWWSRVTRSRDASPATPIPLTALTTAVGLRSHVREFLAAATAGGDVPAFMTAAGVDAAHGMADVILHTRAYMQSTPVQAVTSSAVCSPARTFALCTSLLAADRDVAAAVHALLQLVTAMQQARYVASPEEACVLMLTLAAVCDDAAAASHAALIARAADACMVLVWLPCMRARAGVCLRSVCEAALMLLATIDGRAGTSTLVSTLAHALADCLRASTREAVSAPPRAFLALVAGDAVSDAAMMDASTGASRDPGALTCVYGDRGLAHACDETHAGVARSPPLTRTGEGSERWYDDVGVWDEAVLQSSRDVSVLYDARTRMRVCGDTQVGAHTLEWPQRVKGSDAASATAVDDVYLPHDHIVSRIIRTCMQRHSAGQRALEPLPSVAHAAVHASFDALRGMEPFAPACDAVAAALAASLSLDAFARSCVSVCAHALIAAYAVGRHDTDVDAMTRMLSAVVRAEHVTCDAVTALRCLARIVPAEGAQQRTNVAVHLNFAMLACAHSVKGHVDWREASSDAAAEDTPPPAPLDPANVLRRLDDVIAEVAHAAPRWRAHKLVYVSKMLVSAAGHAGIMPHARVVRTLLKAYEQEPSAVNTLLHQLRMLGHLPL